MGPLRVGKSRTGRRRPRLGPLHPPFRLMAVDHQGVRPFLEPVRPDDDVIVPGRLLGSPRIERGEREPQRDRQKEEHAPRTASAPGASRSPSLNLHRACQAAEATRRCSAIRGHLSRIISSNEIVTYSCAERRA